MQVFWQFYCININSCKVIKSIEDRQSCSRIVAAQTEANNGRKSWNVQIYYGRSLAGEWNYQNFIICSFLLIRLFLASLDCLEIFFVYYISQENPVWNVSIIWWCAWQYSIFSSSSWQCYSLVSRHFTSGKISLDFILHLFFSFKWFRKSSSFSFRKFERWEDAGH